MTCGGRYFMYEILKENTSFWMAHGNPCTIGEHVYIGNKGNTSISGEQWEHYRHRGTSKITVDIREQTFI